MIQGFPFGPSEDLAPLTIVRKNICFIGNRDRASVFYMVKYLQYTMTDRLDYIIGMLLPIIAEGFDSFNTLNLLARSSKTIRLDAQIVSTVAKNAKPMTKKAVRKLFVLPCSVKLSYIHHPFVYTTFHMVPRCKVLHALEQALVTHGSLFGMANAVHTRERRSIAMKLAWGKRKELLSAQKRARRCELEQIRADLLIIPCSDHITTDAEVYYETYGIVKRLGRVYRNKRLMALHSAGLLHIRGGAVNSFLRVSRVDMTEPDTLTHTERLFILRHNIAWEHYIFNYSDFSAALFRVADIIVDIDHVEFLFPLPSHWPWTCQADPCSVKHFISGDLPDMFQQWIADHEALYDEDQ